MKITNLFSKSKLKIFALTYQNNFSKCFVPKTILHFSKKLGWDKLASTCFTNIKRVIN